MVGESRAVVDLFRAQVKQLSTLVGFPIAELPELSEKDLSPEVLDFIRSGCAPLMRLKKLLLQDCVLKCETCTWIERNKIKVPADREVQPRPKYKIAKILNKFMAKGKPPPSLCPSCFRTVGEQAEDFRNGYIKEHEVDPYLKGRIKKASRWPNKPKIRNAQDALKMYPKIQENVPQSSGKNLSLTHNEEHTSIGSDSVPEEYGVPTGDSHTAVPSVVNDGEQGTPVPR